MPLDGTDAQALEHGMTQLEEENRKLKAQYEELEFKTRVALQQHPEECVASAARWRAQYQEIQHRLAEAREHASNGMISDTAKVLRIQSALDERKCPSTYTHSSRGKLACEKGEGHLHRRGDVEHRNGTTIWFSL